MTPHQRSRNERGHAAEDTKPNEIAPRLKTDPRPSGRDCTDAKKDDTYAERGKHTRGNTGVGG
jgi:hypothetical protein